MPLLILTHSTLCESITLKLERDSCALLLLNADWSTGSSPLMLKHPQCNVRKFTGLCTLSPLKVKLRIERTTATLGLSHQNRGRLQQLSRDGHGVCQPLCRGSR